MKKIIAIEILSSILIVMFLYASFSKLIDIGSFRDSMHKQPFPIWFSNILLWMLPFTEIFITVLLIFDRTRMIGLYAFTILMGLFTLYICAILLNFFSNIPCSCGGVIKLLSWKQHLFFNIFFIAMGLLTIFLKQNIYKTNEPI